jgi:hypothetical protein
VGPAFAHIAQVLEGSQQVSGQELYSVRTRLKTPPFTENDIANAVRSNPDILKKLYTEFQV